MQQERQYDPLLQRWRDDAMEAKQQALEEKERHAHLNRAIDVQILREHPTHIMSHDSRVEPIRTKATGIQDVNTISMPQTCVDFNIISNLPFDIHHPMKPDERPRHEQRNPKARKKQAALLRDFNVVTNRYKENHEEKAARDAHLEALDSTRKYIEQRRFDPVSQRFNQPEVEERARCCEDAREVEVRLRAEKTEPVGYSGRPTAHYDLVTHRASDEGTVQLKLIDTLEHQRKSRYKARHVDEHTRKLQDIQFEDVETNQRHDNVAHERWEETHRRGFDIINNKAYGNGPQFQKQYEPFTVPALTTWEIVEQDRSGLTPPSTGRGGMALSSSRNTTEVLVAARDVCRDMTPCSSARRTPRMQPTPRTLSDAGSAALSSARKPPLQKTLKSATPPPAPAIPGSPVGSVYSRPKA
jgi:hypothetical protein